MPGRLSGPVVVRLFFVVAAVVAAMMAAMMAAVVAASVVGGRGGHGGRGLGHCGNRAEQGGGGKQVLFHK